MKRLVIIAASAVLAFMLTACGEEQKTETKVETTKTSTEKPAETPVQPAPQQ